MTEVGLRVLVVDDEVCHPAFPAGGAERAGLYGQ